METVPDDWSERVFAGAFVVTIDTPHIRPPLTKKEQFALAEDYLSKLEPLLKRVAEPFVLSFEIENVWQGCLKVKLAVFFTAAATAFGATYTAVSKYHNFRESVRDIVNDTSNQYKCSIRGEKAACKVALLSNQLSDEAYEVQKNDTLTAIVLNKWRFNQQDLERVMRLLVKRQPEAFVNGDRDRIKVGSVLLKPTAEMLKGVSAK